MCNLKMGVWIVWREGWSILQRLRVNRGREIPRPAGESAGLRNDDRSGPESEWPGVRL